MIVFKFTTFIWEYFLFFPKLFVWGNKSSWQIPIWCAQSPFPLKSVKEQGQGEKGACWVELSILGFFAHWYVWTQSDWLVLKTTLQMGNLSRVLDFLWPCKSLRNFGSQISDPQESPHCSGVTHTWSKWCLAARVSYPFPRHEACVPVDTVLNYYTTVWVPSWVLHDPSCPLYSISPRLPRGTMSPLLYTLDLRL